MNIKWIETADYETMSSIAALRIVSVIEKNNMSGKPTHLGLATGKTMILLYSLLADMLNERRVDLTQLHTYNLDEYMYDDKCLLDITHPLSYRRYMMENLFQSFKPDRGFDTRNINFPDPDCPEDYDRLIADMGGLDFQLLGIGFNGHIAFNEPISEELISVEDFAQLPTRIVGLKELTIKTNAGLTANGNIAEVPVKAITMGMKSILEAGEIMLLACFEEQKRPLAEIRCGRVTPYLPASYLLKHNNSTIVVSKEKINL